jgi:hypothetical protein
MVTVLGSCLMVESIGTDTIIILFIRPVEGFEASSL